MSISVETNELNKSNVTYCNYCKLDFTSSRYDPLSV